MIELKRENHSIAIWNQFEWAKEPESKDFLTFAAHYGSINCFNHLLKQGYLPKQPTYHSIIMSGSNELFEIIKNINLEIPNLILFASECGQVGFLDFFVQKIKNINIQDKHENYHLFKEHHFISLAKMDIILLYNSYWHMKQTLMLKTALL